MKTIKCVVILLAATVSVADCRAMSKPAVAGKTEIKVVVEGNNRFALAIYEKLRAEEGNLFFSPYSISTALAMTYAGARGETAAQMAEVLHFPIARSGVGYDPNRESGEAMTTEVQWKQEQFHSAFGTIINDLKARGAKGRYELTVANALWGQKGCGFLKEFLELVKVNYNGGLNEVDFVTAAESARQTINAWVEKETKNKIRNLIGPGVLNEWTRLVLTNAIYFKGNWARQFDKGNTKEAPFTLLNGEKVNVPMMNQTAEFNYMGAEDFQGLELPYVDDELSMIILLPKKNDGLNRFEEMVTPDNLSRWLGELHRHKVIVSVPKFKMTWQFRLNEVLKSMGMSEAFSGNADFSGMTGRRELFISAVIHKAYVDVNEEGTEAAAATGVVMSKTSIGPEETAVFRADHPFLFLIRDNSSGSILFIGRVMNPEAQSAP
jgi:serpin B